MKSFNILVVLSLLLIACGQQKKEAQQPNDQGEEVQYTSAGAEIASSNALRSSEAFGKYKGLSSEDTLNLKFTAKVKDVCQAKGCWMKLELIDGVETMVRFKDYGFFVPTDIEGKEVIVNGKAFVEELSVEDLQHYARDAGKSASEVAAITETKKTYGFEADGVLIKE